MLEYPNNITFKRGLCLNMIYKILQQKTKRNLLKYISDLLLGVFPY